MSVEVRPLGDKCNLKCVYCYQEATREGEKRTRGSDVTRMIATLDALDERFTLFGGEVMMTRREDLTALMEFGYRRFGGTGLQTNATLIEEEDLARFRDYNVKVGISIDGPGELNDARLAGNPLQTRRATALTEAAILRMCRDGNPPSIIITLHALNARGERLDQLCGWIAELDALGVRHMRLHVLQVDTAAADRLALFTDESIEALRRLRDLETTLASVRFDMFDELEAMLQGHDNLASCTFHACDPYSTRAVVGVEGDGSLTNCGRLNKEGIANRRATVRSFDRQLALYQTPQAEGGCAGCRFFLMCKGNCPGTSINGDWRLRSADCAVWFALFEDAETALASRGKWTLSRSPDLAEAEAAMVDAWNAGIDVSLADICAETQVGWA